MHPTALHIAWQAPSLKPDGALLIQQHPHGIAQIRHQEIMLHRFRACWRHAFVGHVLPRPRVDAASVLRQGNGGPQDHFAPTFRRHSYSFWHRSDSFGLLLPFIDGCVKRLDEQRGGLRHDCIAIPAQAHHAPCFFGALRKRGGSWHEIAAWHHASGKP